MKKATPTNNQALRQEIARVACFEIQALSRMLADYSERQDPGSESASAMRSGLMRLSKLSDLIFETVITDDPADADEDLIAAIGSRAALSDEFHGSAA